MSTTDQPEPEARYHVPQHKHPGRSFPDILTCDGCHQPIAAGQDRKQIHPRTQVLQTVCRSCYDS